MRYNNPFLLKPMGKDYLWGGERLNTEFNKKIDMKPLAESWECSTHPDGVSVAASGAFSGMGLDEIISNNPFLLGEKHCGKKELSILIKLLDAKENLSVQVHPDDSYAREYENGQLGKTEMWYVLEADENARLVYGLREKCSRAQLLKAIQTGKLKNFLQSVPVKKDDVFFIKAGMIHAIGAGTVIAEVEENSNLTYRLYDYDRVDKAGNKREIHIEKALDVACLDSAVEPKQPLRVLNYKPGVASELLCRCKYFEVHRMLINTSLMQVVTYRTNELSYRLLLCINGNGKFDFEDEELTFSKGDCIFVPANSPLIHINGIAQFLEVRA